MRNPRLDLEEAIFDLEDTISVSEALDMYEESRGYRITRPTLIAWASKYHIGVQPAPNHPWRIYPDKLALLMSGKLKSGGKY